MTEWAVVGVLITLGGFFLTIGAPILKLNGTITRLQVVLDDLKKDFDKQQVKSSETHKRIFDHAAEQDRRIEDHEVRISLMEDSMK